LYTKGRGSCGGLGVPYPLAIFVWKWTALHKLPFPSPPFSKSVPPDTVKQTLLEKELQGGEPCVDEQSGLGEVKGGKTSIQTTSPRGCAGFGHSPCREENDDLGREGQGRQGRMEGEKNYEIQECVQMDPPSEGKVKIAFPLIRGRRDLDVEGVIQGKLGQTNRNKTLTSYQPGKTSTLPHCGGGTRKG